MVEARRGLEKLSIEVPVDFDPITSATRERLAKVELLLRSGMGFVMGAPLPPIDILLITTSGPGMPMDVIDYCKSMGLR